MRWNVDDGNDDDCDDRHSNDDDHEDDHHNKHFEWQLDHVYLMIIDNDVKKDPYLRSLSSGLHAPLGRNEN